MEAVACNAYKGVLLQPLMSLGVDTHVGVRCRGTQLALNDCPDFVVYIDFFSCFHYLIGYKVYLLTKE